MGNKQFLQSQQWESPAWQWLGDSRPPLMDHLYFLAGSNIWLDSAWTVHICHSPSKRPHPRSTSGEHVVHGLADIKPKQNRELLPKQLPKQEVTAKSDSPSPGSPVFQGPEPGLSHLELGKSCKASIPWTQTPVAPAVPSFARPRVRKPFPWDNRNTWLN